ncbi:MAG TPA: hypothetical protein VLY63_02545 [Anaerolineae bacterium]|nr:hypothetical protein [Anaerolineae bacterium]
MTGLLKPVLLILGLLLAAALAVGWARGGLGFLSAPSDNSPEAPEASNTPAEAPAGAAVPVLALDAAAPANTETATFAMG